MKTTWARRVFKNFSVLTGMLSVFLVQGHAAPAITSVNPNPVIGYNGLQPLTINGSGFVSGCNVTLVDLTANQTFPNRAVSSLASTQIVINPNFTTAGDTWAVSVTNPDGSNAMLPGLLQVLSPLDNWQWRNPSPTGGDLNGLSFGNSRFVGVGGDGTIVTSADGINWTGKTLNTKDLGSVTYGNGIFVAVGLSGTILASPDAITWTKESSTGNNLDLYGVTFGNNTFVAVGYNGSVLTSSDGVYWTNQPSGNTLQLFGITYGNGTFVAVSGSGAIATSPDGVTWTIRNSGINSPLYGVSYGNGSFVAVGGSGTILTSPDGIAWTTRTSGTTAPLQTVTYGNGTFVTASAALCLVSTDGVSWTQKTFTGLAAVGLSIKTLAYANGSFVAAGLAGAIGTSPDGATWTNRTVVANTTSAGIAYGSGIYVATSGGANPILTSPDGSSWTKASGTISGTRGRVVYGNGMFIAFGTPLNYTSHDGITWATSPPGPFPAGAAYGNGIFATVGTSGAIFTSSNGTTWTSRTSGTSNNLLGITYNNGIFVATGASGTILTSLDGIAWTNRTSGTSKDLRGVAYGNGNYVIVGYSGGDSAATVLMSSDGITWTTKPSVSGIWPFTISYGNGYFIAVGAAGYLMSSTDGITWQVKGLGTFNNMTAITYGNGSFVAVGNYGGIAQSGVPNIGAPTITSVNPSPVPAQNGQQTFTINGSNFTPGCTVTLRDLGGGQTYTNRTIVSQTSTQVVLSPNFTSNPSSWSVEVVNAFSASSGQYQFQVGTGVTPTLVTSPATSATFTPVQLGSSSTSTVTLTNNGTTTISGTATVTGPFTIVGTATYTLQPVQSQTITVQFAPTGTGTQTGYLSFSGGTGVTIALYGSSNAIPTFGKITGTVVDSNGNPIAGVTVSTVGNSTKTAQNGTFTLTGVTPSNSASLTVTPAGNTFYGSVVTSGSVASGQTTSVPNIQLPSLPASSTSANAPQNIPIVFVRGLQFGPKPSLPDPYWSSLHAALTAASPPFANLWDPNTSRYIIDGTQNVDTNAQSLLSYISTQAQQYQNNNGFYPPSINIVAHSMGGLIIRRALNNKSYITFTVTNNGTNSTVNIPVNLVIMLGTPNAGTVYADADISSHNTANSYSALGAIASELSTFFDGVVSETAMSQMTTSYVRRQFNQNYSWPSSVPVFVMAGTGGSSGFPTENPTYGVGLEVLGAIIFGSNILTPQLVNDGVVNQFSVAGQYDSSVFDPFGNSLVTSVDMGPYNLTDQAALNVYLDHLTLLSSPSATNWVRTILQTGQLPILAKSSLTVINNKAANNGLQKASGTTVAIPTEQFSNQSGTLDQGNITNLNVAFDASTTVTLNLLASAGGVNFTLKDPSGNSINSTSPQTNPNVNYVQTVDSISGIVSTTYTITSPAQGNWTATLNGTGLTQSSIGYQLFVSGDSSVALQPTTASFFHNSQEAVIGCSLLNMGATPPTPITVASITAQIVYPDGTVNTQTLVDDGFHGDGVPNDGVYGAILPNITEPGQYYVTYSAAGNYAPNQPFTRYATGSFTVSTEDASIAGNLSCQAASLNASGTTQSIRVNCLVNANVSGTYLLSGVLTDSTGTLQIPASVQMVNAPVGTSTVTLYFDLSTFQTAGYTGTVTLTDLQLSEQTSNGIQWLDAYPASFSIQITPTITSSPPPATGSAGNAYSFTFTASGYPPPTFALTSGSLPTGLALSSSGVLAGTPTQAGTFSGTVTATNVAGTVATQSFTITITGTGGATDTPTMPPWGLVVLAVLLMMTAAKCLPKPSTVSATNPPASCS